MKKLFLFFLILPLAFFACGDDDDNGTTPKNEDDMTIDEYMSENRTFKWNGDWNDPDDPNYKPEYNGKYNPLVGTYWISGKSSTLVYYYSEDFEFYNYLYDSGNKTLTLINKPPYIINNKGYKTEFYGYDLFLVTDDKKFLYLNQRGRAVGEGNLIYKKDWIECVRLDVTDDFRID